MSDDLDQFLLRAAQRRQRRGSASPPRRPPPPARRDADVKDVEIVEAQAIDAGAIRSHVAEQVSEYLDTSGFDTRAAELGDRVETAESQMDRRLEHEFHHQVGRLSDQAPSEETPIAGAAAPLTGAAGEIAALLRSPQDLRRAIILNEILSRPEGRW